MCENEWTHEKSNGKNGRYEIVGGGEISVMWYKVCPTLFEKNCREDDTIRSSIDPWHAIIRTAFGSARSGIDMLELN